MISFLSTAGIRRSSASVLIIRDHARSVIQNIVGHQPEGHIPAHKRSYPSVLFDYICNIILMRWYLSSYFTAVSIDLPVIILSVRTRKAARLMRGLLSLSFFYQIQTG